MKKMGDTVDNNQRKAGSGVLKTTTWGAAIALAFLAAVWGFTSNAPRLEERSTISQAPAKLSTQVTPPRSSSRPAQDKPLFTSGEGQTSRFSGFSFDQQGEKAATTQDSKTAAGTQVASAGPINANPTPQSDAKDQTEASLPLETAQDAQLEPAAKIAPDLKDIDPEKPVDVIVQFRQAPTEEKWASLEQQGRHRGLDLALVKGGTYAASGTDLTNLAADPDVIYISPNRRVQPTGTFSAVLDYHTAVVNAPAAWNLGLNGTGVGVAVIDSGIIDIPDLHNATGYSVDFTQNFVGGTTGSAKDQYGHGSHVAGIIAGTAAQSTGSQYFYTFKGIAPNVTLINLRVLDQNGQGTDSQVISALQWAVSNKAQYNIRVINLSLGRPIYESSTLDPLCQAVESAWKAGIVVVVAAGNDGRNNSANTNGYGTINAPGNDPYVITVGAMNTVGSSNRALSKITSYSSKGPTLYDHLAKPDLVAPGNRIISLYSAGLNLNKLYPSNEIPYSLYQTNGGSTASSTYYLLSGTSMATPMVSGAAALMLQQSPSLTPDQVKARLMKTAYKAFPASSTATDPTTGVTYTNQYDIFTIGAGYLDIQAALANTDLASATTGSALSPAVTQDISGNIVLVDGSSVVWGHSVLWGHSVVWGHSVFSGTNVSGQSVLWGHSVVWGNTALQGYSVVWGHSVVWGTSSTPAGESTSLTINGEN